MGKFSKNVSMADKQSKSGFTTEDAVPIADLLFSEYKYLVKHQIEPWNQVTEESLPRLFAERQIFTETIINEKKYTNYFRYSDGAYMPPMLESENTPMMPQDARKLGVTYAFDCLYHVEQWLDITDVLTEKKLSSKMISEEPGRINIARIPIMVHSNLCNLTRFPTSEKHRDESPFDLGGYFIVNGNEKVLVTTEAVRENRILVYPKKDAGVQIFSVQVSSRNLALPDGITQMVSITNKKNNELNIRMPKFNEFSVFTVFRALGIISDKEIIDMIIYDPTDNDMAKTLRICIEHSRSGLKKNINNQSDAIAAMVDKLTSSKRFTSDADRELRNKQRTIQVNRHMRDLLPHIIGGPREKALYLGRMINKLMRVKLGKEVADDRDNFPSKSLETSGPLFEQKIRESTHKSLKECDRLFTSRCNDYKHPPSVIDVIRAAIYEQGLRQALTTGLWSKKKKGVAQVLMRLSYLQTLSYMRRLVSPTVDASTNKLTSPRHYHNSQAFYCCCVTGDTLITLGDGTTRRVDELIDGDIVRTIDPKTLEASTTPIKNWFGKDTGRLIGVIVSPEQTIRCTPDHPFLVQPDPNLKEYIWKDAEHLNIADLVVVVNADGSRVSKPIIGMIEHTPEPVYDFTTISNNHSFIANGFVTHNCVESPEGHKIGLVKNLALSATVTTSKLYLVPAIKRLIKEFGGGVSWGKATQHQMLTWTLVSVNGAPYVFHNNPTKLENFLRSKKMTELEYDVGIPHNRRLREMNVTCEGGRLIRPLLKVGKDNVLNVTLAQVAEIARDLEDKEAGKISTFAEFQSRFPEAIDWLDSEESSYSMIAMFAQDVAGERKRMSKTSFTNIDRKAAKVNRYDQYVYKRYTHCELNPLCCVGVVTCNTPLFNHNQAPRNIFQYAYARQSIGIYISNWRKRMDISYHLHYPQRPLVSTHGQRWTAKDMQPAGENMIIAIMSRKGYNVEDSLEMNEDAIERGTQSCVSFKKVTAELKKNASVSRDDEFMKPDPTEVAEMGDHNYDKLNMLGYAPKGTEIVSGDAVIGKVTPVAEREGNDRRRYRDATEVFKSNVPAIVDDVWTDLVNSEGYKTYKMRLRMDREVTIGDKLGCYTKDTEVLTTDGWVHINKVTLDHKVATLQDGKRLEYNNPTALQKYDYKGKMYHVQSNQIDLLVTPNHRMWVGNRDGKYGIKKAEDIYRKRVYYKKNVDEWSGPARNSKTFKITGKNGLEDLVMDIDAWLTFFGIWLAEGCVNYTGSETNFQVTFAAHKQRVKDALAECEIKMGVKSRRYPSNVSDDKKNYWHYSDKRLVQHLHPLSVGAINKKFPKWVWMLGKEHCRTLIHGMMLGDGHTMANGTRRYDTSSTVLADEFQRLCLHAGWSCNKMLKYEAGHVAVGKTKTITSTVDAWRMTIITSQNEPQVNKNVNQVGKEADSWVDFDGKVYCCTVPGDGVMYVRYNGMVAWSGNSAHGQKGTVGLKERGRYMPYLEKSGIQVMALINPHAIPSRMTIGQLNENELSTLGAIHGRIYDATAFTRPDMREVGRQLEAAGMAYDGHELVRDGLTGKRYMCKIFVGFTYYQRLKHLVFDKVHARAEGRMQILTRQPNEGRSKDGALRIGEMERDALISSGLSMFLQECYMNKSDAFPVWVCDDCGLFASAMPKKNGSYRCTACDNSTRISKIIIPAAFKLLIQELMAMSVCLRIRTDKVDKLVSRRIRMSAPLAA
jgi:DNA-directed RNA polymerase beta subunit